MQRALQGLITAVSCGFVVFHMALTQASLLETVLVQNIHIGVSLVLIGLLTARLATRAGRRVHGILLAAVGLFVMVYIAVGYDRLINAQGFPEKGDVLVGILLILLVAEATRLQWGLAMPLIALFAVAYYVVGDRLPGAWAAPPNTLATVISNLSIGLYSGMFGQFMSISANDVFLFMVFGGLLESLDASQSFKELGKWVSRLVPGGAGLTTVVSSGLMGTITGTAVSNVAICGAYTIPMMKRDGYPAEAAGAIEATASTGGQLMPPVMGSVAFIMAALLAVPYFEIVKTAIIPALLFYLSVFTAVIFMSKRLGIARRPAAIDLLQLYFYLPLFVGPLIVMTMLLADLKSVAFSAFYAIVSLVVLRLVMLFIGRRFPATLRAGLYPDGLPSVAADLRGYWHKLVKGVSSGGIQGAAIAVVLGVSGLMSEAITATGAAVPIGWAVDYLAGDSLFIALLATAAMCLVLGAGMPTVGAYILTVSIAGPIVIGNGLDAYTANFFILYYACLSAITPPVAAAVLPAAAIAGASYWRTAYEATILAWMLYVLPFLFVYEPALMARDMPDMPIMAAILLEVAAVSILLAAASQRFFLCHTTRIEQCLLYLTSLALSLHICHAGKVYFLVAAILLLAVVPRQLARNRRSRPDIHC